MSVMKMIMLVILVVLEVTAVIYLAREWNKANREVAGKGEKGRKYDA